MAGACGIRLKKAHVIGGLPVGIKFERRQGAALQEGRKAIGFEIEKRHFDLAKKRIWIQSFEFGVKSLELRIDGAEQGVLS